MFGKKTKKQKDLAGTVINLRRQLDIIGKVAIDTDKQNQRLFADYQKECTKVKVLKAINSLASVSADCDAKRIDDLGKEKEELKRYNKKLAENLDELTSYAVVLINVLKKNGITNIPEPEGSHINEQAIKLDVSDDPKQPNNFNGSNGHGRDKANNSNKRI